MRSDITLAYRKEQRGPGPQGLTYIFFNREKYSILTVSVTQLRTYSIFACKLRTRHDLNGRNREFDLDLITTAPSVVYKLDTSINR